MNIINLILLFNLFTFALAKSYNKFHIYNQKATALKVSMFKKKNYPKLLDYVKTTSKVYYIKSIGIINNLIVDYENISDEDKTILEFIISMC